MAQQLLCVITLLAALFATGNGDAFQSTLGHIKGSATPAVQARAVLDLIRRLIPDKASQFVVIINDTLGPEDRTTFELTKNDADSNVTIAATSGVGAAWGFHHYLKYYCHCHVSWEANQLHMPDVLPRVNLKVTSNDRFRYYQNVCTVSYSFAFSDWPRWEKEIDWMAMNAINLPLAFTAQEAIWQRVYLDMNLTQQEIDEHLGGPAFLAWSRMGNIRGFGGPLSATWHNKTLDLQLKILQRMRDFGMTPVLPAFAGHVPRAFERIYPNGSFTDLTRWNRFGDKYCCPLLVDPTDPLFKEVGSRFLRAVIAEFGTEHVYNVDTFNEMRPNNTSPDYIADIGRATYDALTNVDPDAVWLLQGWVFTDFTFWTNDLAEALLTSVPIGRMLVLDLQSEIHEQYTRLKSYFGQPFIWCMLHNFGGTLGLYGNIDMVNQGVFDGRQMENSTMVGTGLTPEGINQNYVMYDFMNEMAWRKEPADLDLWFESYASRRYGVFNAAVVDAWKLLKSSVYNNNGSVSNFGHYILTQRPYSNWTETIWYSPDDVFSAWDLFVEASGLLQNSPAFRHDLVDVTRQVLQILAAHYYYEADNAFRNKDLERLQENSWIFLSLLDDLEVILASNEAFLLGKWIQSAKQWGTTDEEIRLYKYNAMNQITLWGPNGEILDYAIKQWSGVVADYIKPRWQMFFDTLINCLSTEEIFIQALFNIRVFREVELPFTNSTNIYQTAPQGDSVAIAHDLHTKWRPRYTPSMSVAMEDIRRVSMNEIQRFHGKINFAENMEAQAHRDYYSVRVV